MVKKPKKHTRKYTLSRKEMLYIATLVAVAVVALFIYQSMFTKSDTKEPIQSATFAANQYLQALKTCDTELYKKMTGRLLDQQYPDCKKDMAKTQFVSIDAEHATYGQYEDPTTHMLHETVSVMTKDESGTLIGYGRMLILDRAVGSSYWLVATP